MVALVSPPRRSRPARSVAARRRRSCLVVSGDAILRRRLRAAAAARGWACVAPADAAAIARAGSGYGLVFLDLVHPPRGADVDAARLAAAFAADRGTTVVACGTPDRPDEELAARQWGASVYLPGIAAGSGLDGLVRALCG